MLYKKEVHRYSNVVIQAPKKDSSISISTNSAAGIFAQVAALLLLQRSEDRWKAVQSVEAHPELLKSALQVELQRLRVGQVRPVSLVTVPEAVTSLRRGIESEPPSGS